MKSTRWPVLGVDVPVLVGSGVALEAQALADAVAGLGILAQQRERAGIDGQAGPLAGQVVTAAVLGLAGGVGE